MDSRQFGGISVEMLIHSTSFARLERLYIVDEKKRTTLNRNNKQRKMSMNKA